MFRFVLCALSIACLPSVLLAEVKWPEKYEWGHITADSEQIHFHVTSPPADGKIRTPRLYNSYLELYLQSDSEKKPVKLVPEVDHWLITLPKDAGKAPVVVMETVGDARHFKDPPVPTPQKDGSVHLPACLATVHGEKLRFEPQPHKNTVGYWTIEKDYCHWKVNLPRDQLYELHIWQGCGTDQGGSEVEIRSGDSHLTFTVEDTGHFQNFKERNLGRISLKAGDQTIEVRPLSKANKAVMDVRLIVLKPVK